MAASFNPAQDRFAAICIAMVALLEILLGTAPKADRLTWRLDDGLVAARPAPPSI